MTIQQQLDELRTAFPACAVVGLVDLSSGIVLCVSDRAKRPQEQLDSLCAVATQLFNSRTSKAFAKALDNSKAPDLQESVILNASDTCLFLRSSMDPMEVMFCLYDAEIDVEGAIKFARTTLNSIATEE